MGIFFFFLPLRKSHCTNTLLYFILFYKMTLMLGKLTNCVLSLLFCVINNSVCVNTSKGSEQLVHPRKDVR